MCDGFADGGVVFLRSRCIGDIVNRMVRTDADALCRFPEKMVSSMESYGIVVAEVCKANDLPYYYGKNTIAYTSCVLF